MQKDFQDPIIISEDQSKIKSATKQKYMIAFLAIFSILFSILIPLFIYFSYFHRMNISLTLYLFLSIAYEVIIVYYVLVKDRITNTIKKNLKRTPIQIVLNANGIKYSFGDNSKNMEWRELQDIERIQYVDETDSDERYQVIIYLPDEQLIELKDNDQWGNYNNILRWSNTLKRSEIKKMTQEDIKKELNAMF